MLLITGATGFIGQRVIASLVQRGERKIRCFCRNSSRTDQTRKKLRDLVGDSIEFVYGDLSSRADCEAAVHGVERVFHLAAGMEKSFAGAFMASALGTRNLLAAFVKHGSPQRFVNVSSFAVYSNLSLPKGGVLDENCPLETAAQERNDAYGFGKLKQDEVVIDYGQRFKVPYVILRPGSVFGPGKAAITGRVGIDTFGFFLHMGGSNRIPFTYVDNCADAIAQAGFAPGVEGEIFNIVDDDLPTSRQFLRAYKRVRPFRSLPVPYFVARLGCSAWERYSRSSKGQLPPVFNLRRCAAEWKGQRFSNQKAKERLGWKPAVPMNEAMRRFFDWLRTQN